MLRLTVRALVSGWLALACLAAASFTHLERAALALTAREAESVVSILEKLKSEGIQIAYDDEAADDWFEQDADNKKFITKAGFNQKTWKAAVVATMTGYFATIPVAEIKAKFNEVRKRLESSAAVTEEQKRAVRELWDEQYNIVITMREQGKPHTAAVAPLTARLQKLTFD